LTNGLAAKDLCKIRTWDGLTAAAIDKEIERINRWALTNVGKTRTELEWDALNEAVAADASWHKIEKLVEALLNKKQDKVYDVLERYLEDDKTGDRAKIAILTTYLHHDPARAKDLALKYLDQNADSFSFYDIEHDKYVLRFAAALIVFQTGDKARVRSILGNALAGGDGDLSFRV